MYQTEYFSEEQNMLQKWLVAGYGIAAAYIAWQILQGWDTGADKTAMAGTLVFVFALMPGLLLIIRLKTRVTPEGFFYRFVPFHLKEHCIPAHDIAAFEAVTFSPLLDYGGWGIRYGLKGKAYTARGNRGVRVTLQNGKKVVFGSQRPEELALALQRLKTG